VLSVKLNIGLTSSLSRKQTSLISLGPATNEHGDILGDIDIPMVAMDSPEPSSTMKQKLPAAYEALSRHGFKFRTYEET
jgi:hypothetical protein